MTPAHIARRRVLRELDTAAALAGELPPDLSRVLSARADYLRVPGRLEVNAGRLRYWWTPEKGRPVTDRLLPDFLALADADADAVAAFADKWGVFEFCRHGLPIWHTESCVFGPDAEREADQAYSESVADWLLWARRMREVFSTIAALKTGRALPVMHPGFWHGGEPPDLNAPDLEALSDDALLHRVEEAIATLPEWLPNVGRIVTVLRRRHGDNAPKSDRLLAWANVAHAVNEWLRLGRVSPLLLIRNDGRPEIRIGNAALSESVSLFGALALQMMFFAVSGRDVYFCAGCGRGFTLPEGIRRRNPNQAVWCKACGKQAADKIARRKWREKHAPKVRRKGAHRGRKTTRAR